MALTLAACAVNPLVQLPVREPAAGVPTMDDVLARARALKDAYHRKAYELVGQQVQLNDLALGLGVLTVGLGASKAHPDSYRATAFLGGAALLGGQMLSPTTRLDIYQAGIGAVNCANVAALPLQIPASDLASLQQETRKVQDGLPAFSGSISVVESELAAATDLDEAVTTRINSQLAAARTAQSTALAALGDAAALPAAVGEVAKRYGAALDTIEAQVNNLLRGTVQDQAAITTAIASLATLSGRMAPGLEVDKFIADRTKGRIKSESGGADNPKSNKVPGALANALERMAQQQARVEMASVPLARRLAAYKNQGDSAVAELRKCGVSGDVGALQVDRTELKFTVPADDTQSKTVVVSGGSKPYVARLVDSPSQGIEVISPVSGDSSVEVKVPKTVKAGSSLSMKISDASSPPQLKTVTLTIEGTASSPSPADTASESGLAGQRQQLAEAIDKFRKKAGGKFQVAESKNTYTITGAAEPKNNRLEVPLSCTRGAAKRKDSAIAVATALVNRLFDEELLAGKTGAATAQQLAPRNAACIS